MRFAVILVAAAVIGVTVPGCGDGADDPETPDAPPEVDDVGTASLDISAQSGATITSSTLVPGNLLVDHGVNIIVPEAGNGVTAVVELEDGAQVLSVETGMDGAVTIRREAPATTATPDGNGCLNDNPCVDGAYAWLWPTPHAWTSVYKWSFRAGSTPRANNVANVEARLRNAANHIISSYNSCSLADQVSANSAYLGRTSRGTNVLANSGCGKPDGYNVVGFGALPSGVLATTCAWYQSRTGRIYEGDVRITTTIPFYDTPAVPAHCSRRWGVEPSMTHEFGHVFGLGHVDQCLHPNLTMSPIIPPCSNDHSSLGLGDVRGLRQLY
jgi:hypothetical protein